MKNLFSLFLSERGEVGDDEAANAPEKDQGTGAVAQDAPLTEDTSAQSAADATQGEATFLTGEENLDPRKLPPELQPIFKKMQGVYTKRMQSLAEIRDKAEAVDKFYNDRAFAEQTLNNWAAQNGFRVTPINGADAKAVAPGQAGKQTDVPAFMVDAFKEHLSPELHWMAEPQAKAVWGAMQGMLAPVLQQQEQAAQQAKQQEWEQYAEELTQVAPGWEEFENEMEEIYDFFQSKNLRHPKFGSKIQMLYDLATARAASLKQATQRVTDATKNRVTSGRAPARGPSIEQEVAKAPSTQDAWKLAVKHAMAQHRAS